ncbi:T9SS type A sorting domain-containing protein [Aquimarina pacifica]|uniref:T9SS type A sorting domain-containing protein n=1 Tax=Aquimarina pacifica TaxID=1296415 RepID=UPI0013790F4A|nr:T9SS type A sorting domain-containing protein [Aquimarina pacifica]
MSISSNAQNSQTNKTTNDGEYQETCTSSILQNSIAFINPATKLHASNFYVFSIEYVAVDDCEIAVSFWKNNTWVASKVAQIAKGSGISEVRIDLPAFPAKGNEYTYKTHIRPVGTDWEHALDKDQVDNVTILSAKVAENNIHKKIQESSANDIFQKQHIFSLNNTSVSNTNTIQTDIILYPNPASKFANIRGIESGDIIIVYNRSGVAVVSIVADGREEVILTSGLPKGTYIVAVSGKSRQQLRVE